MEFLTRSDLTEPERYDTRVVSKATGATRSRSSVMIQLEADSDYFDNTQSTFEGDCWNRYLPVATPMSEILSSSLHKSIDCCNEQVKSKRIGPVEFLEMLRKKKNTNLITKGSRRRTVSSDQCF